MHCLERLLKLIPGCLDGSVNAFTVYGSRLNNCVDFCGKGVMCGLDSLVHLVVAFFNQVQDKVDLCCKSFGFVLGGLTLASQLIVIYDDFNPCEIV